MQLQSPRRIAELVVLLTLVLAACEGDPIPPAEPPPPVRPSPVPPAYRLRIEPRTPSLELEDTVRLTATVLDAAGRPVSGVPITWTAVQYWAEGARTALSIDSTGLVRTTEDPGERVFTVVALAHAADSIYAADTVTGVVRPQITLQVWPDTNVLFAGMARRLAARRWDGGITTFSDATWASSDPEVASVDGTGRVTATRAGHATITATRGDRRRSAEVYVLSAAAPLRFAEIRPGEGYTCARTVDSLAYCWGGGGGVLGGTGPTDRCERIGYGLRAIGHNPPLERFAGRCAAIPRPVAGGVRFASLAERSPCGLTADGTVYCWGWTPPERVAGLPPMRQLSARCGVSVAGEIYCWDASPQGTPPSRIPAPPGAGRWARVAVGASHRCALTTDGVAYCWGTNSFGALGVGADGPSCATADGGCRDPVPVATTERFTTIAAGWYSTCALRADGQPFCWGRGAGQPWPSSMNIPAVPSPTRAPTPEPLTALTAAVFQSCGLGVSGATYCWGLDAPIVRESAFGYGQDVFARALPPFPLRQVAVGGYHACGIATDGIAWCWAGGVTEAWGIGEFSGWSSAGAQAAVKVAGQ